MTAKKSAPVTAAKPANKALSAKAAKSDTDDKKKPLAKPAAKAALKVVEDAKGKRGRKPKVDEQADKAKKPEDSDVDLSDLESDLEGEPEIEVAGNRVRGQREPAKHNEQATHGSPFVRRALTRARIIMID